jgi:hypothetical protein
VQHGTSWLYLSDVDFDLIHVQWPEALFDFEEPSWSELRELKRVLDRWRIRGTSLVSTIHNEYPHGQDTKRFRMLYRLIYDQAVGLIHLGETSKNVVRQRYPEEVADTREVVIPHGNYEYFPNEISKEQARNRIGLSSEQSIILVFGEIRSREEARLLRKGFTHSCKTTGQLLVAGRLPHRPLRDWRHVSTRFPFWLHPRIQLHETYIPLDEVQIYLKAADVLVIPRIDALNSGNVALGWTFGTVVVGPSEGVIGEMLRKQDCPTFESPTVEALAGAIQEGLHCAQEGKGKRLMHYANKHLCWDELTKKHIDFYFNVKRLSTSITS